HSYVLSKALYSFPTRRSSDLFRHELHASQGIYIGVQILHLDAVLNQIVRQIFSHAFGQRGNQYTLIAFHTQINLIHEIIDLAFGFFDDHRSEEHTSELQSRFDLVCRLLLEKKTKPKETFTIS